MSSRTGSGGGLSSMSSTVSQAFRSSKVASDANPATTTDLAVLRQAHDSLQVQLEAERTHRLSAEKHLGLILQQLSSGHGRAMALQRSRGTEAALEAYHVIVEELAHIPESERRARVASAQIATGNAAANAQSLLSNDTMGGGTLSVSNKRGSMSARNSTKDNTPLVSSSNSPTASPLPGMASNDANSMLVDELRGRIFLLEQSLKSGDDKENLRDQKRINEQLQSQFKSLLLETLSKKRASDEKKKQYNTLLKALAFKTFFRERQMRAQLVNILTQLHATLNEMEDMAWKRNNGMTIGRGKTITKSSSTVSTSSQGNRSSSKRLATANELDDLAANGGSMTSSTHSLHPPSPPSTSPSNKKRKSSRITARPVQPNSQQQQANATNSLPSSSSAATLSTSSSVTPLLDRDDSLQFLSSGDEVTLRDADDYDQAQLARKNFLEHVIRAPKQKLTVLLEALQDVLAVKLESTLKRLNHEANHTRLLAETHLQTIIALSNEKASFTRKENEWLAEIASLRQQLAHEKELTQTQAKQIADQQHEAHLLLQKRTTEEQKQMILEQRNVAALVDRSHTLRRKVRDSEAVLAALEKKKLRLQRQGFTTGTSSHGTAASPHSGGGLDSLFGMPSKQGIGGGGLGLLTMAMMQARDELKQTELALLASRNESALLSANGSTADLLTEEEKSSSSMPTSPRAATAESYPTLTERGGGGRRRHQSPPAADGSPSSSSSRTHLTASSSSLLTKPDPLPIVTQATIGRLQLTLPIVPLYNPAPVSDRTRPMSIQPLGASVGFSGVTGLGVSAGLRVGQRLDRRLGDFERIAVQQLNKSSDQRRGQAAHASAVGSSTGSVSASAATGSARFAATAYKGVHVPSPITHHSNGAATQRPHTTYTPFYAGNEMRVNSAGNIHAKRKHGRHVLHAVHATATNNNANRGNENGDNNNNDNNNNHNYSDPPAQPHDLPKLGAQQPAATTDDGSNPEATARVIHFPPAHHQPPSQSTASPTISQEPEPNLASVN